MVEFHLWLQVHLLAYTVHVGTCVCVHMCFSSSTCPSGGQRTRVLGSVHIFTAKLPAAVSCEAASVTLTCTGLSAAHESFCGSLFNSLNHYIEVLQLYSYMFIYSCSAVTFYVFCIA